MKKVALLMIIAFICGALSLSLSACVDDDLVGTYRAIDFDSNTKYYLELYSNKKCKLYRLGEGEIEDTLIEGLSLFYGKFNYKYDDKSDDKKGTITITITYEGASGKYSEDFEGVIESDGDIKLYDVFEKDRTFKKQN